MESSIFIDDRIRGMMYLNLPTNENVVQAHRSTDDGKLWDTVKFNHIKLEYTQPIPFEMSLHDPRSVPKHFEWIDIQYVKENDYLQPFLTIDGGHSWSPTPKSASRVIMLTYETVILSISHDMSSINYSLDHGTTWLSLNFFPAKSTLLYIGAFSDTDLTVLAISRNSESDDLSFHLLDFSNIFIIECKTSDFQQVPLPKSRGFCFRGKNIDKITRYPDVRCINKLKEHMKVESFCTCTSDDLGCVFNYQSKDDICVLDPLSNITEEPLKCEKGTHVDITQLGCDPHEVHNDSSIAHSIACVQNGLFFVNRIDQFPHFNYGAKDLRVPVTEVILNNKVSSNSPITFDNLQQHLYTYMDNYITRFQLDGPKIQVLYYLRDPIVELVYDPLSHILIYLTNRQQLKILSMLTSYEHVVSDDITWFTYSPHHRLLSMVRSKNHFCYCELLGMPKCLKSQFDLLETFVDFHSSRVYLLTTAHVLMIQQFFVDPTSLQPFAEISDVSYFSVFDYHLYFLVKGELLYRNVKQKNLDVSLIKNLSFNRITLHRESIPNYKYSCESLKCPFFCQAVSTDEATCGCPHPTIRANNKCICPSDHANCTLPQCIGYQCRNSKCLLDNVRCNGVDDCGDNSDEIGCESIAILTKKHALPTLICVEANASTKTLFVNSIVTKVVQSIYVSSTLSHTLQRDVVCTCS
ncbi:Low-density lipoprotein receptor-related protein 2 [Thelohanellus kitauei]|uniref:Low-density lipoprotein receptor-related protein 2 n=1 Tax=Thelohanellus kitauei TaxID=669202 RepID=A0A0C2M998_THEKT|nr:Low-density lipoprotein receptor-related protein 2 [Thelohanellus kitauei]